MDSSISFSIQILRKTLSQITIKSVSKIIKHFFHHNKYFKIIFNRLNHNLIYHYSSFLSLVGCGLTVIIGFVGIYYVGTSSAAVVLGLTLSFLVSFFVHYNINYSDNLFIKIIQLLIANIFILITRY